MWYERPYGNEGEGGGRVVMVVVKRVHKKKSVRVRKRDIVLCGDDGVSVKT